MLEQFKNRLEDVAESDLVGYLLRQVKRREKRVLQLQHDVYEFGIAQGYTDNQVRGAVNDLFNTFAAEWSVYVLAGSDAIVTAIENDATLPWLNTAVGQSTVRAKLVARLV